MTLSQLNKLNVNTLAAHLGIQFTEIGNNFLVAEMSVDHRTIQPFGLLHGGASVALAETLGSVAGYFCLAQDNKTTVGLCINCNHIKSIKQGKVIGKAIPVHLGANTQVWEIKITDESDKLISISRLTLAIINK